MNTIVLDEQHTIDDRTLWFAARLAQVQTLHRADRTLISQLFGTIGKLTEQGRRQRQALRRIADGAADPVAVARGAL